MLMFSTLDSLHELEATHIQTEKERGKKYGPVKLCHLRWFGMEQVPTGNHAPTVMDLHF
jgi:hypothetical protein